MVKRHLKLRKIASMVLVAALTFQGTANTFTLPTFAFSGTVADENATLSTTEVLDGDLLRVMQVLVNYYKENKTTPSGNLLSASFDEYATNITIKQALNYEGPVDLSQYSKEITNITGIGYLRNATEVNLSGLSITAIPANEFAECQVLQKITIPAGVRTIGENAFYDCFELTDVVVEGQKSQSSKINLSNIDKISKQAFYGCKLLEDVTLKDYDASNELVIGENAFTGCVSLTAIDVPISNADNFGQSAFSGCTNLDKVTLRDDLNYIPVGVFNGDTLSQFTMSNGNTYIG